MSSDANNDRAELQDKLDDVLRQQRELLARVHSGQTHFKQLAKSVWQVQEEEQRKIARELHDGIGQNLNAIINLIDQTKMANGDSSELLIKMRTLAKQTLDETRALSRLLRPQILDDLGLEPALQWLARTMGEAHDLSVSLDLVAPMPAFTGDIATLIFRVTQEALNNAAKHAHAQSASVTLRCEGERLHLCVRDDGKGCDVDAALNSGRMQQSSGLGGMRDRVRLYDGEMRIQSDPGAGFNLAIEIPLPGVRGAAA
ncbi:MAG TPA: sensor histidine kinase [Rudaea sp.]|jgi:signal transduction histidine kinase|nr:sensor histidine kinase [Rudaea sp.]